MDGLPGNSPTPCSERTELIGKNDRKAVANMVHNHNVDVDVDVDADADADEPMPAPPRRSRLPT